ncbi:hypothetical protein MRX96_059497 [Rhipicephalus microplus]
MKVSSEQLAAIVAAPRSLQRRHVEGSEFLLGRAASEGVYTWYVAQHRSASGDLRRLAARLLGDEVLERWQTATGITLDADSPVAVYQQAVGDVLEACPMSELAERLQSVAESRLRLRARLPAQLLQLDGPERDCALRGRGTRVRQATQARGVLQRRGQKMVQDHDRHLGHVRAHGEGATCGERQMVPVRQRPPQDHEVRAPRRSESKTTTSRKSAPSCARGPSTTPTGHHGNTTVPHAGAARAGTTSCGYGIAVAALVWANVALRA